MMYIRYPLSLRRVEDLLHERGIDIRTELSEYLEIKGYQVEVAGDGREALDKFEAAPADVVIADIKMPRYNGYELIRQLRAMDLGIRVIAMTGDLTQSGLDKAKELGATMILKKPINLRLLAQCLKRWNDSDEA